MAVWLLWVPGVEGVHESVGGPLGVGGVRPATVVGSLALCMSWTYVCVGGLRALLWAVSVCVGCERVCGL